MSFSLTHQGSGMLRDEAQPVHAEAESLLLQSYERQMIYFAAEQEADLKRLRAEYVFDGSPAVSDFLKTHRALPGLLLEAVAPLRRSFGAGPILHLRVQTDNGSRTLCALVFWKGALSSAKTFLEVFDNTWWLANSHRASGNVTFDFELV
jgi:hypothetical protein